MLKSKKTSSTNKPLFVIYKKKIVHESNFLYENGANQKVK